MASQALFALICSRCLSAPSKPTWTRPVLLEHVVRQLESFWLANNPMGCLQRSEQSLRRDLLHLLSGYAPTRTVAYPLMIFHLRLRLLPPRLTPSLNLPWPLIFDVLGMRTCLLLAPAQSLQTLVSRSILRFARLEYSLQLPSQPRLSRRTDRSPEPVPSFCCVRDILAAYDSGSNQSVFANTQKLCVQRA